MKLVGEFDGGDSREPGYRDIIQVWARDDDSVRLDCIEIGGELRPNLFDPQMVAPAAAPPLTEPRP